MYNLYNPFFKEEYGSSFGESWEIFCLKLLKLHYKDEEIEKRNPPESGVDLYFPKRKIAFQCKSVSDKDGKFNITHAKKSLKDALSIKNTLKWEKFILCVNGELTGSQLQQLKDIHEDIEVFSKYFWIQLCENHREIVQKHFRVIIDVPISFQIKQMKKLSLSKILVSENEKDAFKVLFYSPNSEFVYITVHPEMTVENLYSIIKDLLQIPDQISYFNSNLDIYLLLCLNDEKLTDTKMTLKELRLTSNSYFILYYIHQSYNVFTMMLDDKNDFNLYYSKERTNSLKNAIKSYLAIGAYK